MPKKPVSKNIARLNEDIRRELIGIVGAMKDPRLSGGLLTVTRVETAGDLAQSKVYVSVMGREGGAAPVVHALHAARGHVRSELAARMHIRKAPELIFIQDDSAEYADKINKMLRELNTP